MELWQVIGIGVFLFLVFSENKGQRAGYAVFLAALIGLALAT